MHKRRVTISMSEEDYIYFKEQAKHHTRSMANLFLHAMRRFCTMNKLPRERNNE